MDLIGQTLGSYHVRQRIGEGGIGVVYRAWDGALGRDAAVKILRPEYAGDARLTRYILKDAQTAARLSHPNIVTIYTVGTFDGRPYFIMEYIEGEWLRHRIDRARQNPAQHIAPMDAGRIAREVAKALDHAHQRGVAHLDVKPENIVLATDGRVVLTDFGIARHFGDAHRTHHGGLVGTVLYMAPEQLDTKYGRVSPATDIYALGAVLYEMLTNRPPFKAQNHFALIRMHLQAARPRASKAEPRLGTRFDGVIERAMAIQPRKRYRRAWEFSRDVATAAHITEIGERPTRPWIDRIREPRLLGAVVAVVGTVGLVIALAALRALRPDDGGATDGGGAVTPTASEIVATDLPDPSATEDGTIPTDVGSTGAIATDGVDGVSDDPADTGGLAGAMATDTPGPSPTSRPTITSAPARTPAPGPAGAVAGASPISLLPVTQSGGCVQFAWQPASVSDSVVVCRGAECRTVFTGDRMYPWNPKSVFDDAVAGDVFDWSVIRAGRRTAMQTFGWMGGDCGSVRKQSHADPPGGM